MRLIRTASTACGFAADQADVSFSLRYLRSMQIHLTEFHGKDWTEVLHLKGVNTPFTVVSCAFL
ncbi:hypothetical protein SAMN05444920_109329 [Nonomuraea solani]|uniref:Uncharacterized protein n=1 Tax=Nonomuraea solani TaxID=1144553 RepID=A0A1H6EH51_9ACTN|nr:hypothetical protein SAMN05444920_109329 [Nonomuraea solani]